MLSNAFYFLKLKMFIASSTSIMSIKIVIKVYKYEEFESYNLIPAYSIKLIGLKRNTQFFCDNL